MTCLCFHALNMWGLDSRGWLPEDGWTKSHKSGPAAQHEGRLTAMMALLKAASTMEATAAAATKPTPCMEKTAAIMAPLMCWGVYSLVMTADRG